MMVATVFFRHQTRTRILSQIITSTTTKTKTKPFSLSSFSCLSSPPQHQDGRFFLLGAKQQQQQFQQQRRGMMARTSEQHAGDESPEKKAVTFIVSLGHDAKIAQGVVDALASSGLSGGALLSTVRSLAGRWEVDEDAGLEDLIESVKIEMARTEGKKIVQFYAIPPSGWTDEGSDDNDEEDVHNNKAAFLVKGYEGMSVTDVAKFGDMEGSDVLGEYLECACSGIMACSTCHVIIGKDWFQRAGGEPDEDELDMIDLAYNPKDTSRLGCQVVLKPELDGMVVKLPKGVNNMMDYIPFEDEKQ